MRFVLLLVISVASFGMDVRGNYTINKIARQAEARINLPRNHYFQKDSIFLDFSIINHGDESIRMFPAMEFMKTWQLVIQDENRNIISPVSDEHMNELPANTVKNFAGDEVKEVILHKNESFNKRINISEIYSLKPGSWYYVTAYFYPDAVGKSDYFFKAENTLSFYLDFNKKQPGLEPEVAEYKETELVTPEEVIHLFLGAEKNRRWNNYMKWLDLGQFILAYDQFSSVYIRSDEDDRLLILDEFKKFLTEEHAGKLNSYKITGVDRKGGDVAEVRVYVERIKKRVRHKFEYWYNLKKDDNNYWKINGVMIKVKR